MLKQIEGSHAMAEAIALCRPEVICAYPITPQTHIVEGLGELVKQGALLDCEFINVESEFAALSVAIGASAAGARAYTATASQGLLFMAEAVYNASGLGLPIVMTLGNRAIGAPINIWNDHSDAMSMRDAGWLQLFAETNQEAVDLHIQAFKLAEELSMPVMVCVDGFILTHAVERIDIPIQQQVDAYLPPYDPVQVLDPAEPASIGAMVGPEAFTEVRFLAHYKQTLALKLIPEFAAEFAKGFGRDSGGLLRSYRAEDADMLVVAMGSVCGTIKDTIDEMRDDGIRIGLVVIVSFRPFPVEALRNALAGAKDVVVVEKSIAVGMGGQLANNVDVSLRNLPRPPRLHSSVAGLGGTCRSPAPRCIGCSGRPACSPGKAPISSTSMNASSAARFIAPARPGARDRPRRIFCASSPNPSPRPPSEETHHDPARHDAATRTSRAKAEILPEGHLHRRQPAGRGRSARGASLAGAIERADLRSPRLPGLRRGARRALCHRRGDARHQQQSDRRQRHRLPRGVHHALSGNLVAIAMAAFAVRQCRGGRHRRRGRDAGEEAAGGARDRARRRRRHHRHRLPVPVRHVRAQR